MAITRILSASVRHYRDNGQTTAYVEWIDARGTRGRTEGIADEQSMMPIGAHMGALFARARHEGVTITRETW